MIGTYQQLKQFLISKTGLRMYHIYKPVMLLAVIRNGGTANKRQIAEAFQLRDDIQIEWYRRNVHPMPGKRLVRDGLLSKDGDQYSLHGVIAGLSDAEQAEIEQILEQRIADHLKMRNPFGDSNLDAVRGSVRYEVIRRAAGRCEACGVSSKDTQIDVDHIVPRARGGSNDPTNLQALCRTCNSQKRDKDDTDFSSVHDSYAQREEECIFCYPKDRIVDSNELAYLIEDGYPVSAQHALVIPKRHVADYFDLHLPERNAIEQLLHRRKAAVQENDPTVSGFNVGINVGRSAGQTIFHVHVHLIPRRHGDTENPQGGVRHVIPGKGYYKK